MLGRQGGPYRAPRGSEVTAYVHVVVDDVDKHFERAKQSGASIVEPPTDTPFGVRQYTAKTRRATGGLSRRILQTWRRRIGARDQLYGVERGTLGGGLFAVAARFVISERDMQA